MSKYDNEPLTNLKAIRKLRGYTQQELADELHIRQDRYSNYERGKALITTDILMELSRILDVSTDYILGMPNAPLHVGNDEVMDITGLDEVAVETLRTLKDMDTMISDAHNISIYQGEYKTAFSKGFLTVLNTLLSNPDMFGTLATAFINYADNSYINPVHKDNDTWVPLNDNEFGLATDISPKDNVPVRFNAYTTKAIHKNTLDILISEYATAYHKATTQRVPSLRSPQGRGGSNP